MEDARDIFQHAAGMKVRRTSYEQVFAGGQHAVVVIAGRAQCALGLGVHRNLAFTARGRLPPAALGFDQRTDGVPTVADHLSRPPNRRLEEHTSELQSLMRISYAVFCLKKKQ